MRAFAWAVLAVVAGSVGAFARLSLQTEKIEPSIPRVGTHPGGVGEGRVLDSFRPALGDSLVGFSSGCFWGAEQAFRKMPGIVATAVGYMGGASVFPTYETAHKTGHVETVLVEFNPNRTPFSALLKTFWSLPRSLESESPNANRSSYRAAIWTYNSSEQKQAVESRDALQIDKKRKLRVRIQPAQPFYMAEESHQQFDEKSGTEACPIGSVASN